MPNVEVIYFLFFLNFNAVDLIWTSYVLAVLKFFLFSWRKERKSQSLSHVQLFAIPWTVAHQAPLSMEFFRQEYWSGQPLSFPGDLSNPGIDAGSPAMQADSVPSEPPGKPLSSWKNIPKILWNEDKRWLKLFI